LNAMTRFGCFLISGGLLLFASASPVAGQRMASSPADDRPDAHESVTLSGLPLDFVENRGQWDGSAAFVARQGRLAASLEPGAVKLLLTADRPTEVSLTFAGASKEAVLTGEEIRRGRYNFFIGNDRQKWRSNVSAFGAVRYRGLYEGVDLRVLQQSGRLEYDVLLAPGADLAQVVIRTEGTSGIQIDADGTLILETAAGPLRQSAPVTWEEQPDGTMRRLESRFRKIDAQQYGFDVAGRDSSQPLVIDPGLEWSTFLGGSNREEINGLALARDGSGDVVVAGSTWSNDFPTAPAGSLGSSPLISFVARLNSSGTALVYATLFGGTNGNVSFGLGLALDASSGPIVVGETNAANFPTTPGAYQPTFNEPSAAINRGWDGFVTRFNATGSQMVFSTFLGAAPIFDPNKVGSKRGGDESARNVVIDASDNVIVSGYTTSENFPTTVGAYDRTHSSLVVQVDIGTIESRTDAFVARLTPNGSQLTYSTYLGGQSDDLVKDMVIDAQGVLTLVGIEAPLETFDAQGNRTDHGIPFPTTPDAVARTHLGASDTFVARLRLDGTGTGDLKYSTILGGFYIDEATGVALDPNNPELVTLSGYSRSWDFPTTAGAWKRAPLFLSDGTPYYSGVLVRFRFPASGGGSLVWSTLVGGTGFAGQFADSVAVDTSGDVIVVGADTAGSFPTTDRSYKRLPAKGDFVARFSGDGRSLLYSTLLHQPSGVLVLRKKVVSTGPHAVVVAGSTLFTDFPTTPGAFDRVFGSNGTSDGFHTYDGYAAKLTLDPNTSSDTTAAAPALVSPANGATLPLNGALTFDWTDVADPSGVQLYEVEVSANAEFASGFTFFQLGAGSYAASQSEGSTSQEGIHYWRVRTLDGANNFSPWSEVRKFTVGAPVWTNFAAVTLTPNGVVGGSTILGRVHIQNTAPAGGQVYTLSSSNPSAASVPASVTVPAGGSSATFTVTTHSVSVSTPVMLTVWSEGNGDHPVLWVDPGAPAPPGTVTLSSLAVTPSSVAGGASSSGTVTLSAAAAAGGAVVAVSSSSSAASVPGTVTVAAGATTATFSITTSSVTSSTPVTITANFGGVSRSATLTVTAPAPPPTPSAPTLVSPANQAIVALPVTLDWSDVTAAASYLIQIDDASTFSAPRVVEQMVTMSQFTVASLAARQHWWRVRGINSAGTAGAWSSVRSFTPQSTPAPSALSAVSVTPSSVIGGNASQGTVTLTTAAPSGGFVVTLSDNSTTATVPASVTAAQGAASATFAITTSTVTTSTPVTITATAGAVTRTTTLTVAPAGQNATLTVTATGRSGERITSSPAGINVFVGSSGSASFAGGTAITLSVSNGRDAIWSGACSSGGSKSRTCTFTLTATASVTANVQ
jgi:hypothetical protein